MPKRKTSGKTDVKEDLRVEAPSPMSTQKQRDRLRRPPLHDSESLSPEDSLESPYRGDEDEVRMKNFFTLSPPNQDVKNSTRFSGFYEPKFSSDFGDDAERESTTPLSDSPRDESSEESSINVCHSPICKAQDRLPRFKVECAVTSSKKEKPGLSLGSSSITLQFIAGVLLATAVLYSVTWSNDVKSEEPEVPSIHSWKEKLQTLREEFPSTSDWEVVNKSVGNYFFPKEYPTVLTLIGLDPLTVNCLAEQILGAFNASYFDAKTLMQDFPDPENRHDELQSSMERELNEKNIGGILNLDQLDGKSAMVLNSFADHENSPCKKCLIIITLSYNLSSEKVEQPDGLAEDCLMQAWTDIGADKASSIVNRILGATAVFQPQNPLPCS